MFIIRWVVLSVVFLALTHFFPGMIRVTSFWTGFWAAIVLGLVSTFIKPILVLLTLPVSILTLGLFTLVINTLMIWLVSVLVSGFVITGFGSAFLVALAVSVVGMILDR